MHTTPLSKTYSFKSVDTILVISTRQIGDLLLTTPLIHTLRQHYPLAKIDVLVFKGKAAMLEGNFFLNDIISVAEKPSFKMYWQLVRRIFRKYDVAIVTQTGDRPHLYGFFAAKQRVGLLPQAVKHQWWKKALCKAWQVLDDIGTHTVVQNLLLAKCMGLSLVYDVTPPRNDASGAFFSSQLNINVKDSNYVLIHPYPMWQYKLWTIEAWHALVRHLQSIELHVVISGGSAPNELDYCKKIAEPFSSGVTNLAGKTSFADAAFLLRQAHAYVGMDTAMTHLAAACNTPTLALFGPTNPVKWAPWPFGYRDATSPWQRYSAEFQRVNNVLLLQGLGDCVPCHQAGCDKHNNSHSRCLDELSVSRVIDALNVLLGQKNPQKIIPICASS